MNHLRRYATAGLAVLLAAASAAWAQQADLHIGYVYPAGGEQGTTFEAVVAGQHLGDVGEVIVSGGGVQAAIGELIKPISGKELNALRVQVDELMAKKAVVRKDFAALERFRSFKNAKNVEKSDASADEELKQLKKKYAGQAWTADDEKLLRDIRKKMGTGVRKPANPAICELAVVRITVAPDAVPGQRELRIATPSALSNPLVFYVGQLPEYSEEASKQITQEKSSVARTAVAPKSRAAKQEMHITLPAAVNGQILPGEVDRFQFTASEGQRLVIACSARQLIPYIPDAVPGWFQATLALYDAEGKELAYDDDYQFHPDPVLHYRIPADGEYVVEIKDAIYRGREDFVYRITVGELPFVTSIFPLGGPAGAETSVELRGWNLPVTGLTLDNTEKLPGVYPVSVGKDEQVSNAVPFNVDTLAELLEKEPNSAPGAAQQVALPVIVNGHIDRPDDSDVFAFEGRGGSEIVAEVYARRLNSPLDSVLKLTDASGRQLAMNNDHEDKGAGLITHQADSWLSATLPEDGTYYLHLDDGQHKGGPEYGYRLRISPPRPDFQLRVVPSSISARGGTAVPLTVYAVREDGFSGEIEIILKDAPKGFTLSGGRLPAGQDHVRFTLSVPAAPQDEPLSLHLEGRATIAGQKVSHPAVPAEDMMQAFAYRHLVPVEDLEVAVVGRSTSRPSVQILGELPVKIPAGGTARVEIAAPKGQLPSQIRLQLSEPPEGIEIQRVSPSPAGLEMVLSSDAAKVKPGLQGNLILTAAGRTAPAKGKSRGSRRSSISLATLPAIPFDVVAP